MSALGAAEKFGDVAHNGSKGCGTIMRVAPVAFMGAEPLQIEVLGMETSALTHGHRTGQEAAAAWAIILAEVLRGTPVEATAHNVAGRFGSETREAIRSALTAPRDGRPETVESLGGGWTAEEALAIALYAVLASTSFEEGFRIAVTHGGDSDSTGAIAGNLLGLIYAQEVMAHPWRREIECADVIDRLARDMDACLRHPDACDGKAPGALKDRYPSW
ncbi:ADP-ribosylglycohydrolase-like protein [Rubellimicrobium mesophilum DSM 19309]|uniref:ADP-ribosylglycohydrolase-like protein n=2 Tax=Rubellimicrobium TaxID=295418 RepID=A0A017HKV1_9RHOB|nr:ADP-ribosylglycohydrolase-like protein [Rubellimicrobium mesophilum DSM 19309]